MVYVINNIPKRYSYENAMDLTGFGRYNIGMLVCCSFLALAMFLDIFGLSVLLPAIACDMELNTNQQGLLSAVPLLGVVISSYGWGLAADIIGRRKIVLFAMPVGLVLNIVASLSPNLSTLAVFKFLTTIFITSGNSAAFVLMAESVPIRYRDHFMFVIATVTFAAQLIISCFAIAISNISFNFDITWLNIKYRHWRLLLQLLSLPGGLATFSLVFLKESPKYLLSKQKNEDAISVLQTIFQSNTRRRKEIYPVTQLYLDEAIAPSTENSILKTIWNQTVPLFKPPLLRNSIILYYLTFSAFMIATGFTIWLPTIINTFFSGDDNYSGHTFCQVATKSVHSNNTTFADCDHIIQISTLYIAGSFSLLLMLLSIPLLFMAKHIGKKLVTSLVFGLSTLCGLLLFFTVAPMLIIGLLFMFIAICLLLGNINAYLVQLSPTHLRSMATCLAVVVARGSGIFSVQIIVSLLENYCTPMFCGYVALLFSGFLVSLLLPSEAKLKKNIDENNSSHNDIVDNLYITKL